jgi:glutamate decarboxylase
MFNCACRIPSRLLVCERSLTLAVLNLGFAGYRRIMQNNLSKGHTPFNEEDAEYYYEGLPVVSFRFTDEIKENYPELKQAWMQEQLRAIGWIVPK